MNRGRITNEIKSVSKKTFVPIVDACKKLLESSDVVVDGKKLNSGISNFHQLMYSFCQSREEMLACRIVADSILMAEKNAALSGFAIASKFANSFSVLSNDAVRINHTKALRSAGFACRNDIANKIFFSIIKHTSADSKITISRQPVKKPLIKLSNSKQVRIKINDDFIGPHFSIPNRIKDVDFIMVNGAFASVNELDWIFYRAHEKKRSIIILSKSYNNEIISTIKHNFVINGLKVFPFEFGFDLESINSLSDIVSIVGGLPLSSELGDFLSRSCDDSRIGFADDVVVEANNLIFPGQTKNTELHAARLSKQIADCQSRDKIDLLTKRLTGLTGNTCEIILPNGKTYDHVENSLATAISTFKACCTFRCVKVKINKSIVYMPEPSYNAMLERLDEIVNIIETTSQAITIVNDNRKSNRSKMEHGRKKANA